VQAIAEVEEDARGEAGDAVQEVQEMQGNGG
jgi:hypothetical protein